MHRITNNISRCFTLPDPVVWNCYSSCIVCLGVAPRGRLRRTTAGFICSSVYSLTPLQSRRLFSNSRVPSSNSGRALKPLAEEPAGEAALAAGEGGARAFRMLVERASEWVGAPSEGVRAVTWELLFGLRHDVRLLRTNDDGCRVILSLSIYMCEAASVVSTPRSLFAER